MNTTPDSLSAVDEAMLWLNEVEKVQGGSNGPTIKLRAAIVALGEPVSATIESIAEPPDALDAAREDAREGWALARKHGDKLMTLEINHAELRHEATRALVAWDGTVLPKGHDAVLQERMEGLRTVLG